MKIVSRDFGYEREICRANNGKISEVNGKILFESAYAAKMIFVARGHITPFIYHRKKTVHWYVQEGTGLVRWRADTLNEYDNLLDLTNERTIERIARLYSFGSTQAVIKSDTVSFCPYMAYNIYARTDLTIFQVNNFTYDEDIYTLRRIQND